jgi:HSP20 family molecular chaperone IbpA
MADKRTKLYPYSSACVDDEHLKVHIEVYLPGVEKDDIKIKMTEEGMCLSANREDKDVEYVIPSCNQIKTNI